MKRDLKYERFYGHSPERVWQALTDSRAVEAWFMANDFQPIVGHKFQLRTEPGPGFDGVLRCEVVLVDPPRQLAYTFRGGMMMRETLVTWTLTPKEGGTLVRLEHTGFTGLKDIAISGILDFGWRRFLRKLPGVLDALAHGQSVAGG